MWTEEGRVGDAEGRRQKAGWVLSNAKRTENQKSIPKILPSANGKTGQKSAGRPGLAPSRGPRVPTPSGDSPGGPGGGGQ